MTNAFSSNQSVPQQAAMFTYDIPATLKIPNPSHMLEGLGMFRVNYSVWVGTMSAIAMLPLSEWNEKGVRTNVVRFEKEEWERVRALAERSLADDLSKFRNFMDSQIAKAEAVFVQADSEQSAKLTAKGRWLLRHALNDGKRRVRAARATLLMFDLLNTREDLIKSFEATDEAYHAAHETRAWLRRNGASKVESESLDFEQPVEAEVVGPDPFAALDFLSGRDHTRVKQ